MKDNKTYKGFLVFSVIAVGALLMSWMMMGSSAKPEELSYNEFLQKLENKDVSSINIVETNVTGLYVNTEVEEEKFPNEYDFKVNTTNVSDLEGDLKAIALEYPENLDKTQSTVTIRDLNINIYYDSEMKSNNIFSVFLPYILIGALIFIGFRLFMKQVDSSNNKAASFGKSKARTVDPNAKKVTFEDVAGADEEKEELKEIVEFLKDPKKFTSMGARIPKGVLLIGPPGTGKTLLARAIAGESEVPFLTISGSDFVEMYVGVGASRVRDLFAQAKKTAPSIIFIDEIDAVGRHRGSGLGGGHDEREQTLNQLLVEMDGFAVNEGIIVIAATNRVDILDNALLRPGRFDRRITVSYPDVKGREEILNIHAKGKPLAKDANLEAVAKLTPYTTGADLENILNEAAILSARADKKEITMEKITEAIDRVQMGPEKKSRKVTQRDVKLVAYHETGHALVANLLENCDPVHEVSIIPRGTAGGYTRTMPLNETNFITRAMLTDKIAMGLGGYVAEEIVFGDISTGSTSDLKMATGIARKMVTEFGMNKEIGPIFLANERELVIGREIGHMKNYSEELSAKVDKEVTKLIIEQMNRARKIIKDNKEMMEKIVKVLLKKEKIDGDEFRKIIEA